MNFSAQQRGFNLIELMVAMVIGVFLIAGALRIYTQSQAALLVSTQTARLQEAARYAISAIEKDVRSVDLWGLTNRSADIGGKAVLADTALYNVQGACENNWAVDLSTAITGGNNTNPYGSPCIPTAEYKTNTDVLVVRHAESAEIATANLQAGQIYVRSSASGGNIFVGTAEPSSLSIDSINSTLTTIAYWISDSSDADTSVPSLRRSYLTTNGVSPAVVTEEVISGIEDLQVQYGVDTTGDNSVNSYLDFDDVVDPNTILVARIWLRVRSENPEQGFSDNSSFVYADGNYSASGATDATEENYRRLLVTKTIELRNRRAPTALATIAP